MPADVVALDVTAAPRSVVPDDGMNGSREIMETIGNFPSGNHVLRFHRSTININKTIMAALDDGMTKPSVVPSRGRKT